MMEMQPVEGSAEGAMAVSNHSVARSNTNTGPQGGFSPAANYDAYMKKQAVSKKDVKNIRALSVMGTFTHFVLFGAMVWMACIKGPQDVSNVGEFDFSVTLILTAIGALVSAGLAARDTKRTFEGTNSFIPSWEWHNNRFLEELKTTFLLSFFLIPSIIVFVLHGVHLNFWTVLVHLELHLVGFLVFLIVVYIFCFFCDIMSLFRIAKALKDDEEDQAVPGGKASLVEAGGVEVEIVVSTPFDQVDHHVPQLIKEFANLILVNDGQVESPSASPVSEGSHVVLTVHCTRDQEFSIRDMIKELVGAGAFHLATFPVVSVALAPHVAVTMDDEEGEDDRTFVPKGVKVVCWVKLVADILLLIAFAIVAIATHANSGPIIACVAQAIVMVVALILQRKVWSKKGPPVLEDWLLHYRNVIILHLFVGYVMFWLSLGIFTLNSAGHDSFWGTLGHLPSPSNALGFFTIGLFVIQYILHAGILLKHNGCMEALDEIACLALMQSMAREDTLTTVGESDEQAK